jgi:hypothetical protein
MQMAFSRRTPAESILAIYKLLDELSTRNNPHLRRERRHLFI